MITISEACPNCGEVASYSFYERIYQKRLYWSASFNCPHCGTMTEADDIGKLPEMLRSLVLAKEGRWQLELASRDAISLKALREILEIPLNELAVLKEKIPCIVYEGTKTEVEVYQIRLKTLAPEIKISTSKRNS